MWGAYFCMGAYKRDVVVVIKMGAYIHGVLIIPILRYSISMFLGFPTNRSSHLSSVGCRTVGLCSSNSWLYCSELVVGRFSGWMARWLAGQMVLTTCPIITSYYSNLYLLIWFAEGDAPSIPPHCSHLHLGAVVGHHNVCWNSTPLGC